MSAVLAIILALAPQGTAVEQAESAWAAGDYETAAARWAEAYEQTGEIRHVFARGQALAKLERCEEAIEVLEAFIATEPKEVAAKAARQTIEDCRATLPEPDPEPPAPLPETAPPPPIIDTPPPREPPPPRKWYRDPLGGALFGTGMVTVATGAVLAGVARLEQSRADSASDLPTFSRHDDRAVTLSRVSVPVLAVGGALVVGAVIRYAIVARKQRRSSNLAWYRGRP